MSRTIAVVTSSRADYSHLYWPLKDLQADPEVDLKLIVLGAHLSPHFGSTVEEIERDGFAIAARIECLISSDTDVGMAKTLGVAMLSLADALATMRPDLLLLIADRYEMLAPACVALTLRIPIAHIEGGEISEGAIDDAVRNAITKMAHLHFTSTETARGRVIAMGEEAWRVKRAGAPSLDHLRRSVLLTRDAVREALGVELGEEVVVVAYHPVTLFADTTLEADALFAALEEVVEVRGRRVIFCYPNSDAGSYSLMARVKTFCERHAQAHLFVNLPPITYWSLLRESTLMIGNSSSGIMEAASFHLPVVNVGMRQAGRERGPNILDAPGDSSELIRRQIERALSREFRESLRYHENIYGDGHAAERIVAALTSTQLELLLHKRAPPAAGPPHRAMRIPLSAPDITESEVRAVAAALRSPQLSLGSKLEEFELAFTRYVGVPYAVGVSSGTAGLHLALLALGVGKGDEVIVPSFTFIAAANAIRYVGAVPVFVDVAALTLNMTPEGVRRAITPHTRAILVVHTFGVPADVAQVCSIAREHQLVVVEDACEALGAEVSGRRIGSFGDAAVFAFYPNKQMTTGEGGMVVAKRAEVAARVRSLSNQGRTVSDDWFQHTELGYNYRLSEVACALGIGQMARLQEILARRDEVARTYSRRLANVEGVVLPPVDLPEKVISWFVYVVRLGPEFDRSARDAVVETLKEAGIGAGRYFAPIHQQPAYAGFRHPPLPVTEAESARTIALPFFNRISEAEIAEVVDTLIKAIDRQVNGGCGNR